ncbi:MAG: hypothetical protein ACXVDE_04110 [Tumebacillaceae bacterium]
MKKGLWVVATLGILLSFATQVHAEQAGTDQTVVTASDSTDPTTGSDPSAPNANGDGDTPPPPPPPPPPVLDDPPLW